MSELPTHTARLDIRRSGPPRLVLHAPDDDPAPSRAWTLSTFALRAVAAMHANRAHLRAFISSDGWTAYLSPEEAEALAYSLDAVASLGTDATAAQIAQHT